MVVFIQRGAALSSKDAELSKLNDGDRKNMLLINVRRAMGLRGIADHYKFLLKHGIPPVSARNIMNGEAMSIKLDQMERLCLALNCTPNDLLEWRPTEGDANAGNHSLDRLRNHDAELEKLPLEQVRQIIEALRESK